MDALRVNSVLNNPNNGQKLQTLFYGQVCYYVVGIKFLADELEMIAEDFRPVQFFLFLRRFVSFLFWTERFSF